MTAASIHPSHETKRELYQQHPKCVRCGADAEEIEGFSRLLEPCRAIGSGDFSIGGALWPGLSKLIEECGEVLQVAGKLMGSEGRTDHWSGDLNQMLVEEIGDLLAAAHFFVKQNGLDLDAIERRRVEKYATFKRWHHDTIAARQPKETDR